MLLETAYWTEAQKTEFENECFRAWLNIIDARINYDTRRKYATVDDWRLLFEDGYSEVEAIKVMLGLDYMPQIPLD